MKVHSRNKIALLVFFAMVALGIGGVVGYLMIGHNWNVAASNIDDAAGSMEGYTTIVYEGVINPAAEKAESSEELKIQNDPTLESPVEEEVAENSAEQPVPAPVADDVEKSSDPKEKSGEVLPVLDIDEVVESYQKKKSAVFNLDIAHGVLYENTMILKKQDKRIAVFNVLATDTPFKIERQVSTLKKYSPDYIVAIVPDSSLVKTVDDIDIVISTSDEDFFIMGETIDGTFYVASPTKGSVGAILISPSGVVSAKVLSDI